MYGEELIYGYGNGWVGEQKVGWGVRRGRVKSDHHHRLKIDDARSVSAQMERFVFVQSLWLLPLAVAVYTIATWQLQKDTRTPKQVFSTLVFQPMCRIRTFPRTALLISVPYERSVLSTTHTYQ